MRTFPANLATFEQFFWSVTHLEVEVTTSKLQIQSTITQQIKINKLKKIVRFHIRKNR